MGKQNIRKSRVSYIFCVKQKSILFPKHGESQFQEYGKTKIFQIYEFLEYTIPITWEKWVSIVRGKYRKTQTFQIYWFLKYFGRSRNPCISQNMRKVDFHSTGKVWDNTNIPKLWVSQIFWAKLKSIQFPKHGKSGFP